MSETQKKAGPQKSGNSDWQSRKDAAFPRAVGNLAPVFIERASNAEMWDVDGQRYIDFATGIAVCSTGHSNPKVIAAVEQQLQQFSHTCLGITPYSSAVVLAEKLNELAPGSSKKKTMFVTTGAEAVENCVKIARASTGRRAVIAFNGSFHGRTMMALGLTGKAAPYKNMFGPMPADIYHVPYPVEYHGVSIEESLNALQSLFKISISPDDVAAIIIEPVQGEGGFYPAPNEFLKALRELCDEHGIVLIADEIQTGFARTGKFFCCEYAGIEPDLLAAAKAVAGGFPLAAVIGKAEIMDAPMPGGLGGTYAGSPIGCAAALAVIDIIAEQDLVERANQIGSLFEHDLLRLQRKYPDHIGDVRTGRGAMIAMELVKNGDPDQPDSDLTNALVTQAWKSRLILLSCGIRGNVIRFLPALTISDDLINEGIVIVEACLKKLVN